MGVGISEDNLGRRGVDRRGEIAGAPLVLGGLIVLALKRIGEAVITELIKDKLKHESKTNPNTAAGKVGKLADRFGLLDDDPEVGANGVDDTGYIRNRSAYIRANPTAAASPTPAPTPAVATTTSSAPPPEDEQPEYEMELPDWLMREVERAVIDYLTDRLTDAILADSGPAGFSRDDAAALMKTQNERGGQTPELTDEQATSLAEWVESEISAHERLWNALEKDVEGFNSWVDEQAKGISTTTTTDTVPPWVRKVAGDRVRGPSRPGSHPLIRPQSNDPADTQTHADGRPRRSPIAPSDPADPTERRPTVDRRDLEPVSDPLIRVDRG